MKHLRLLFLSIFISLFSASFAQLSPGDVSFTGWNADGNDDFSIVALAAIPSNTTIYFLDTEWDGSQFDPTDEGDFTWNSGTGVAAGTVITFYGLSTPAITVSHGSVTYQNSGGLSTSSEAIFCFLGTAPRTPTTMLAAIANASGAYGTLANTGLIEGLSAITLPAGVDIAEYNGPRTGIDANGYLTYLNDTANWDWQDGSGDQSIDMVVPDVPFNTTSFTFSATDVTAPFVPNIVATDQVTVKVYFSEDVTSSSATNTANYSFTPTVAISNISYSNNVATITHAGLANGISHTLSVSGISDASGNTMVGTTVSNPFFFNTSMPNVLVTEIMYNPASANSNFLEFVELTNVGTTVASLGGFVLKDGGSFQFTFPQTTMQPGEVLVFATDKDSADTFYGVSFIDLQTPNANVFGNGGEIIQLLNASGDTVCEVTYDDASPWPLDADGNGPSLELRSPSNSLNDGTNWKASANLIGQSLGSDIFATPGTFVPETNAVLNFTADHLFFTEGQNAEIEIAISGAPTTIVTVDVTVVANVGTATSGADFTFLTTTLTFPVGDSNSQMVTIPLTDNTGVHPDKFFVIELSNASQADLGINSALTVFIIDDEDHSLSGSNELGMSFYGNYLVDGTGSAEIVQYDSATQRLFVMNSTKAAVEILDFSDPSNVTSYSTIDLSSYGIGGTSVAVHGNVVAATIESANFAPGKVVFFDTDGTFITSVEVGVLPDMITFTPDGLKAITANEGQPNDTYTIDSEGTISIIDLTVGINNVTQSNVTTLNFNSFDSQAATLKAAGVRIFGPNATVSQDMEPEYVTMSDNSEVAFVTLQENNALAIVDLVNLEITDILPLGFKDHMLPQNALDASDKSDTILFVNYPVFGMYMPDAIAQYSVNGTQYLVTANEGDAREYGALEEETGIGSGSFMLDSATFSGAGYLKNENVLGRLNATNTMGDTDNDGDFDEIYVFGSRSFSIWDATTGALVFDSGDDLERITANDSQFGSIFNASNSNDKYKNRSDNKGPEPEGVTVSKIGTDYFAFITLERIGGVVVYNITDPTNPIFVNWLNNRGAGASLEDLGPEGIIYIPRSASPIDTAMVVLANEVSATISFYSVIEPTSNSVSDLNSMKSFLVYPNPANDRVYFDHVVSFEVFDAQGKVIARENNVAQFKVSELTKGMYFLRTSNGEVAKLVVE